MYQIENVSETIYFLPEDGSTARKAWLDSLAIPVPRWIEGYGFTMTEAFEIIAQHESSGIPQHLLLDYSQSQGFKALGLIKALIPHMKVGSLTLTTAGIGSKRTRQIFHTKAMVQRTLDSTGYLCWDGSVNFSESGWDQANIARQFQNTIYAENFIKEFESHRAWARENLPHYQVSALSEDPITSYFASLSLEKVLYDLQNQLAVSDFDLFSITEERMYQAGVDLGKTLTLVSQTSQRCQSDGDLKHLIDLVSQSLVQGVQWLAALESVTISPPVVPESAQ